MVSLHEVAILLAQRQRVELVVHGAHARVEARIEAHRVLVGGHQRRQLLVDLLNGRRRIG